MQGPSGTETHEVARTPRASRGDNGRILETDRAEEASCVQVDRNEASDIKLAPQRLLILAFIYIS